MKRLKSPKSGENGEAAGKQEEEVEVEGATGNWGIGFRECWGWGGGDEYLEQMGRKRGRWV